MWLRSGDRYIPQIRDCRQTDASSGRANTVSGVQQRQEHGGSKKRCHYSIGSVRKKMFGTIPVNSDKCKESVKDKMTRCGTAIVLE